LFLLKNEIHRKKNKELQNTKNLNSFQLVVRTSSRKPNFFPSVTEALVIEAIANKSVNASIYNLFNKKIYEK